MREGSKTKKIKYLKKIAIWSSIILAIYTICGFFILPPILKSVSVKKLKENLNRDVTIQDIKINPYKLSISIKGLVVKEPDGSKDFVSFDELYLNFQSMSALKLGLIIKELRIERPYVRVVRKDETLYNFSDLLKPKQKNSEKQVSSKPIQFFVSNIQISDAHADLSDIPKNKTHKITDVRVTIPFLSNFPYHTKINVEPFFRAKINGTPFSSQGRTKPFAESLETVFDVNIRDFNIPNYLSYLPFERNFEMPSGFLDTVLKLSYLQAKNRKPRITLTGRIALKKVGIEDKNGNPLLSFPKLDVFISPSEILSGRLNLSEIILHSPDLHIRRDRTGKTNIHSVLPENIRKTSAQEKGGSRKAPAINVRDLSIEGARIFFSDLSCAMPFKTVFDPLDLKVNNFSTTPEKIATYRLSIKTDAHEQLQFEGNFSLDPLQSEGRIEFNNLVLKRYSPYYRDHILFDIIESTLDVQTNYNYSKNLKEPEMKLSEMEASLSSTVLRKRDDKKDFLSISAISIGKTDVDLTGREIEIGEVFTEKGLIHVRRTKNGDLNLLTLIPAPRPSDKNAGQEKIEKGEKPLHVTLKKILMDQYRLEVEDLMHSQPVKVDIGAINLKGEELSTKKNKKGKIAVSFNIGEKGTFSADGSVGIDPVFAGLKLKLKDMDILPFQPYFSDIVNVTVTDGRISTAGKVEAGRSTGKKIRASFKGELSLTNFASVDKVNSEGFVKWDSFYVTGIDFAYNPTSVKIDKIALTDFFSSLIVNPDGTINVQRVLKEKYRTVKTPQPPEVQEEEPASEKDAGSPEQITIKTVTLQGGRINFTDKHIKPNYSATLEEVGGRVSGLTSMATELADVNLMGKLGKYGPLEITGKINPLREDLYVDLKIKFKDIELSPMTPYSGKYVGYTIEKGKLYLDLKYKIAGKKLDAENKIFLDQFTLGERVESPDATKLPVSFAVALLKNRKGEIDLDIPVSGNIDDPEFSIVGIIFKIIGNLIVKAATSPFALLKAIAGGGDDISYLEFDDGSHTITEKNAKKLDTLIKALYERPALKLEIEGHVDMEKDREGLRKNLFNKKLKSQKLKEMLKKGLPAVPVDEVRIEADEYETFLKMAYKATEFPKPRNAAGLEKKLPPAEMEKLLMTNIEIKNDDLRLLAYKRAEGVKSLILKSKKIEPGRLFLVEPKSLSPEKKEKLKESRVDFKLK
jgi:uncharacterized protein involved in outer membrane biogenesis